MTIPGLFFLYFRLFNAVIKTDDSKYDWIRIADLWYWKWPLYQLRHNNCPQMTNLLGQTKAVKYLPLCLEFYNSSQ